ncbi:DUF3996 domain-containing protein [Entomospira entomophila]|uniref:DUF3996 domain-containing protein n=1 Tax=Entomospira entomophila TaxID=2719988 RepID=A0A968G8S1_9SPIO|nr:DUF3996 domain-containing protein [Entomospira entomophilus]NIZ40653.1 DUF3996 domain-containing protein [Entomospira entomophilus]WDI34867.1 DUF3996 domain-containing protein [Entomospira entomophilus]
MKKLVMVVALSLAGITSAHAGVGLGVVFGGGTSWSGWGFGWNAGLSLGLGEFDRVNWEFGLKVSAGSGWFGIRLDADWHFYQLDIVDFMAFYVGVGPYVNLDIFSGVKNPLTNKKIGGGLGLDVGARLPLGLRFFFADHFDVWVGIVPQIGLHFGFGDLYANSRFKIGGGIGGEIGIRYWF